MTHRARYWLLSACLGVILSGGAARAADPVYADYGDGGQCSQSWVLSSITNRFRYQVEHVPNLKDVRIEQFDRVHEHRYIPAGEDRPIARRYCGATVTLSDGDYREIWYLIETGQGFATLNNGLLPSRLVAPDNVEFCVAGFDRWLVYNGACRVLR
ncbi:MAG TPA: hypothetical protein VIU14_15580 [Mesorhizobium sp.]|jgi:hypothetical protein